MDAHRIASTDFRLTYASLTEPVEVTVLGRVIGSYYPRGTTPEGQNDLGAKDAEITYLKRELAKRLTTKVIPTVIPLKADQGFARANGVGFSKERQLGAKEK